MKPLHIEYLMGYDIGIIGNYSRPQEQELIQDYLKGVPFLTISSRKTTQLQQQVAQLTVRNEEQKLVIERESAEKEKEADKIKNDFELLKREQERLKKTMESLFKVVTGQSDTVDVYTNVDDPETSRVLNQWAREHEEGLEEVEVEAEQRRQT